MSRVNAIGTTTSKVYPKGVIARPAPKPKSEVDLLDPEIEDLIKLHKLDFVKRGMENVTDGVGDSFKFYKTSDYEHPSFVVKKQTDNSENTHAIHNWHPARNVYISAQTGRGKNYFIENTLIPYLRDLNLSHKTRKRIMVISNRIALTLQTKDRLRQGLLFQKEDADNKLYSYKEYSSILGAEFVDVVSYQGFLNRFGYQRTQAGQKETSWHRGEERNKFGMLNHSEFQESSKYLFVICDEAHFFTSDAMFNPYTDRILQSIVNTFQDVIRVYMTATPHECLGFIEEHESRISKPEYFDTSIFFDFKRNYEYLDIKYYSDIKELKDIIKNSGKDNWLVFIDNIEKGREFKVELESDIESLKNKVYAVNADSKEDENYQKMVIDERIDVALKQKKTRKTKDNEGTETDLIEAVKDGKTAEDDKVRVLIATSVLDNGVNFRNIQNVVVSDISRVKILQMVGRARVDLKKGERVTLYIKRFTESEVSSKLYRLQKRQDDYLDFETSNSGADTWFTTKHVLSEQDNRDKLRHKIGLEDEKTTKYFTSEIAASLVDTQVLKYEAIIREMQGDTTSILPGQKHLERMLGWFGHRYNDKNDITLQEKDGATNDLLKLLESYASNDTQLSKDEQMIFRRSIALLINKSYGKQDPNSRIYSKDKLNKIFGTYGIGYKIKSVSKKVLGKNETHWGIVKK